MRIEQLETCFVLSRKLFSTVRIFFFFLHLITIFSSFSFVCEFQHCSHNGLLNSAKNSAKLVLQHCSHYQPLNSAKLVLEWCEREVFSPVSESINFVVIRCNNSHISMTFRSRE